MLIFKDTLRGQPITICYTDREADLGDAASWLRGQVGYGSNKPVGIDTESTGLNSYARGWELRTVQFGGADRAYVIPARFTEFIAWVMRREVNWLGHNGTHDIRCIDQHLGFATGVKCMGETFIPSHHADSRNAAEGGVSHGLKEQCIAFIDPTAGKWEAALKAEFKRIEIPIPDAVYKSGPRKGQPRTRKATYSEGWGLIDPRNPAYIEYAGADPILTYHLWHYYQRTVRDNRELFDFDMRVQQATDRLQRRAIRLDVPYTRKLSAAYLRTANECEALAADYGCTNIDSGAQLAKVLGRLGVQLTERTRPTSRFPEGQVKTSNDILRKVREESTDPAVREFIRAVLIAKQCHKRRESYTEAMLRERDSADRVHPSINILGARTARMSVSNPALQQLPTKDRDEEDW